MNNKTKIHREFKLIDSKFWFLRGMVNKNDFIYIFAGSKRKYFGDTKIHSKIIIFNIKKETFESSELEDVIEINQVIDNN